MNHTRNGKKQLLSLLQTGGIGELNHTTTTNDSKTTPSVHEYVLSNGKKLEVQIENEIKVINKKIAFCQIILRDLYPIQIGQGDIQPLFVLVRIFVNQTQNKTFITYLKNCILCTISLQLNRLSLRSFPQWRAVQAKESRSMSHSKQEGIMRALHEMQKFVCNYSA
jgi:hypothetical protein